MSFEPLALPKPILRRASAQRRTPMAARQQGDLPLRLSLGGMRLPRALLIVINVSRVHQYFGFLNHARPALLLFLWAIAQLLIGGGRNISVNNWKERPSKLIVALGAAAMISVPFGIS